MTMNTRPIAIELFAGAGGLSLGFEQAGFDVKVAVEIDPVHAAVHAFNFPDTCVMARSVIGLTGAEIRKAAGIGSASVDCVSGGAPCQGFSMMGKRALDDPRNKLALEFLRLVKELDAKSFVFENVKGLTVGNHKKFLEELVSQFELIGYECLLPWQVLNAANYGVPQSRERLILMGVRKDIGIKNLSYPLPTTNIAGRTPVFLGLPMGPSCSDALSDLPDAEGFEQLRTSDSVKSVIAKNISKYAIQMRSQSEGAWLFGYVRKWDKSLLTSSARTEHSDISRRRFRAAEQGSVEPISRFFKLPENGVANTLRAGTDGARGAFTSPRPIHYRFDRCVTVREMARLHGFPDWFRFNVTKWHGARQIGNAVPPPLAYAVATQILKALNFEQIQPNEVMSLGNPQLLELDLTSAAKYFDVVAPPSRRDRKSGATKRKQIDIEESLGNQHSLEFIKHG